MIHETITLNEARNVTLTTYFIENSRELQDGITRPAIIICPGGGYSFLSDREAEPVALSYLAAGFHAAILRYGIGEHAVMPGPILDLAGAVACLKENAEKWFIDRENVYVCGFSAGGHVSASLCVFWNRPDILPDYEDKRELIRPAGAILGYPVLDLFSTSSCLDICIPKGTSREDAEFDSKHPNMPLEKIFVYDEKEERYMVNFETAMNAYLFGGEYTKEQEKRYSLPWQVDKDTPPAFLWHGCEDNLIYPRNSLMYAAELDKQGIPCELHLFGTGGHGLALANHLTCNHMGEYVPDCSIWMPLSIAWLNRQSGFQANIMRSKNRFS